MNETQKIKSFTEFKNGFTLLEVLIYFSLITIILLVILEILNVMGRVGANQTAKTEVERNLDFVSRRFTYWGLRATSTVEVAPTSTDQVTFRVGGDKKFSLDTTAKTLKLKDGTNPEEILTTSKVEVAATGTKLFTFVGDTIQMKIKISYKAAIGSPYTYSENAQLTVSIR